MPPFERYKAGDLGTFLSQHARRTLPSLSAILGAKEEPTNTIAEVARQTGLSSDVIRIWERRYGVVHPVRVHGIRRYSDADVLRLQLLARAVARGERISSLSQLSNARIRHLLGADQHSELAAVSPRPENRRIFGEKVFPGAYGGVVASIAHGLAVDCSSVYEYRPWTNELVLCAQQRWSNEPKDLCVPVDHATLIARAFRATRPLTESEAGTSLIAVSFGGGTKTGVIAARSLRQRTFVESDLALLNSIAQLLSAASRNTPSDGRTPPQTLASLVNGVKDPLAAIDRGGRITYMNESAQAIFRDIDLVGRFAHDAIPHLKDPEYRAIYDRALANNCGENYEVYSSHLGAWFEVSIHPISNGFTIQFRNISHLRQPGTRPAITTSVARMLLRNVPGAVWTTDSELTVQSVTGKLITRFGQRKGTALGRSVDEFFTGDAAICVAAAHRRALAEGCVTLDFTYQDVPIRLFVAATTGKAGEPLGTIAFAIAIDTRSA